jgi:dTDP-4-amino-4,6-dideoxygalactose transaminase
VRLLQQYGWRERYVSAVPGGNSRLDELQAAILHVKLRHLDADNQRRRHIAALYTDRLAATRLALPQVCPGADHVFHQYAICLDTRDDLRAHLRQAGIGTLIHYPMPVHLQPAYRGRVPVVTSLFHSERVAGQILSLPIYPQLSNGQVEHVVASVRHFLES